MVTGMAGAGRASALRMLEDMGYEALDNFPLSLLPHLFHGLTVAKNMKPLAIGIDSRTRGFSTQDLASHISMLRENPAFQYSLLFLECEDEVLQRRFTETRRRHPMAPDRPIADGISLERQLLRDIKSMADITLDTSELRLSDLKNLLIRHYEVAPENRLIISIVSFAYRFGLPREADLVFDVRFLRNPHYEPTLKPFTGLNEDVVKYIEQDEAAEVFFKHLTALVGFLFPNYEKEGKSYLTIGIGCTGGRHRSVYMSKRLAGWLAEKGRHVQLLHRDIGKETGKYIT